MIRQIIKFIVVGFLNLFIDLGVLNALMWATGLFSGPFYSLFKAISFSVAVINSYICNKFWTFHKTDTKSIKKEFTKFFLVAVTGLVINVIIASAIVHFQKPLFGLSEELWATIGGICAAFGAAAWDFLCYKFFVFGK